jgi:xanthine dehydrogenase accessory factor
VRDLFDTISEAKENKQDVAICTIVNTRGSTPRKIGAKMLVYDDRKILGTIGGGEVEKKVIEDAINVIKNRKPEFFKHDLLHQHNMCCGGSVDIYIEPVMNKNKLYIFGAGHLGQKLAEYAVKFDFDITVIDDRKEFTDECNIKGISKMNIDFQEALQTLQFDENVFVCIMTYSHAIDRSILSYCIKKPFAYLGMIGSQRKVEMTKKMFTAGMNIPEEDLNKVDMPMGINISAEGPDEIAISILAKLIEVKHKIKV